MLLKTRDKKLGVNNCFVQHPSYKITVTQITVMSRKWICVRPTSKIPMYSKHEQDELFLQSGNAEMDQTHGLQKAQTIRK